MSYNVAICAEPVPSKDEEAWQAVDSLIDAKGEPPEVFKELHDRLTRRYPCICTLSDDRVDDDGVSSDGPLWNDFGHRAAVLGMGLFTSGRGTPVSRGNSQRPRTGCI